jgi:UDP-N-acetylglucosamine 2-epimerase
MKYVVGVIGNSSSGILEASSLRKGTINIGNRQKGRLCAKSVIHCPANKEKILKALELLTSAKFRRTLKSVKNLYEQKSTSLKIARVIEKSVHEKFGIKEFHDLKGTK